MPLDATAGHSIDIELDPLVKMGLTPISEGVVDAYKADYRAKFLATNPPGPGPFEWRTYTYDHYKRGQILKSSTRLENFIDVNWEGADPRQGTRPGAPEAVVNLAKRVEREVQGAEFAVDYFYRDPVLHITYPFAGKTCKAYLAIWDLGVVKAIAG